MSIHRHRNLAGFTLVELLTVVAILAIATAVVLPQIGSHDDLKVSSAARELTADLLYAQSQAIATGKTHFVVFNAKRHAYVLMNSINPPTVLLQPTTHTSYEMTFDCGPLKDVKMTRVDFDGQTTIAFDELGAPYSFTQSAGKLSALNEGSIELSSGEYKQTIIILPGSGAIKIE